MASVQTGAVLQTRELLHGLGWQDILSWSRTCGCSATGFCSICSSSWCIGACHSLLSLFMSLLLLLLEWVVVLPMPLVRLLCRNRLPVPPVSGAMIEMYQPHISPVSLHPLLRVQLVKTFNLYIVQWFIKSHLFSSHVP